MDKFSIINKTGQSYNVMPKGYNLNNFGYANDGNYVRMGNRYVNTLEYLRQGNQRFSICFPLETAEVDYFKFILFLQEAPLRLQIIYDGLVFYLNVRVKSVEKKWLPVELVEAEITFNALSPYYKIISSFNGGGEVVTSGGKKYNYTYNYRYTDSVSNSVYLDVDSSVDSPIRFAIYGPCVNPYWSYYRNGVLVSTGKVNITVPENRKIVVDTTTLPYSINMLDLSNNFIQDVYGASDFSTERFIYFNQGRNRITVGDDSLDDLTVGLEAYVYYASI